MRWVSVMTQSSGELLRRPEFWEAAFDADVPFRTAYTEGWRYGILCSDVPLIDLHREAIYYLNDGAVWPVVSQLLEIASLHPEASFVESLEHFLGDPTQQARFEKLIKSSTPEERSVALKAIETLRDKLIRAHDEHLVHGFKTFGAHLVAA